MKTAATLMNKKAAIKMELDSRLPQAQSDALWARCTQRLDEIIKRYADIPAGERTHTDNYIFPAAAIYLTLKDEVGQDMAYSVIESAAIRNSEAAGKKLAKLMRFPPMRGLFISVWTPMTKYMFGPKQGFKNVFYPKQKGVFRMDVTACPYCRYLTELGCPELIKTFCANDERCYGSLPGLAFERRGTLGTGADQCDFCIRRI